MADTLEVRIAHLEGAYEQIDKRLGTVEAGVSHLRQEMAANFAQSRQEMGQVRQEISQLRQEVRQEMNELRRQMVEQFRWIFGFQILAWITVMGTLLALLLRR